MVYVRMMSVSGVNKNTENNEKSYTSDFHSDGGSIVKKSEKCFAGISF